MKTLPCIGDRVRCYDPFAIEYWRKAFTVKEIRNDLVVLDGYYIRPKNLRPVKCTPFAVSEPEAELIAPNEDIGMPAIRQFRRLAKPQPCLMSEAKPLRSSVDAHLKWHGGDAYMFEDKDLTVGIGTASANTLQGMLDGSFGATPCPYGVPGDLLWIKETWSLIETHTDWETGYVDDIYGWEGKLPPKKPVGWHVVHRAGSGFSSHFDDRGFKWRPSSNAPRWGSRYLIEIKRVRFQRLSQATTEDKIAECVIVDHEKRRESSSMHPMTFKSFDDEDEDDFSLKNKSLFADNYATIYGNEFGNDPWTWVIEFELVNKKKPRPERLFACDCFIKS